MDEPALIQEAQRGDLDSFNTLILHYQDILFNTALRIMGDDEAAADATQEAFLSAFRAIKSFRGGSFKAWLLRTVTNACYDELRRQKRRPTTPLEPEMDDGEEMEAPRWLADPSMSPEEEAEVDELEHAIQHCLDELPDEFRAVVVLTDIQGMDYKEVSAWAPSRAAWRARACACANVYKVFGNFYPLHFVWKKRASAHDPNTFLPRRRKTFRLSGWAT